VIVREKEQTLVRQMIDDLRIKAPGSDARVGNLSGGNQQKVVLAKALLGRPEILLLDEPTRGIDIGTKAEIYALTRRLADEGKAVVMVSSELPEIIGMSDRVVVLNRGTVTGQLTRDEAHPEAIMQRAMAN
jgi:ABC-type sugar transport system ATPase subunit